MVGICSPSEASNEELLHELNRRFDGQIAIVAMDEEGRNLTYLGRRTRVSVWLCARMVALAENMPWQYRVPPDDSWASGEEDYYGS